MEGKGVVSSHSIDRERGRDADGTGKKGDWRCQKALILLQASLGKDKDCEKGGGECRKIGSAK